jgi:uncharacterized membrane protein YjjB (DUF3815 family)
MLSAMRLIAAIVAAALMLAIGIAVALFLGHDAGITIVASFLAALGVGVLTAVFWPRSG